MRCSRTLLAVACAVAWLPLLFTTPGLAQGIPQDIPRQDLLIVENPEGTIKNAGWFNIWAINAGGAVQRPAASSRWTRSGTSIPRAASTASGTIRWPPRSRIYNADFTEMTVKLRRASTGATASSSPPTTWSTRSRRRSRTRHALERGAASQRRRRRAPDRYTVVFKLKKPNSRFHATVHRALERDVDHAEARLREGGGSAEVRLQQAGLARRLHAAQLRSGRQVVHLAAARRLAAHHARRASASPGRNMSPMSIPGRPTSA